jgi:hypothetical protein
MPDGYPDHLKAGSLAEFADKLGADWKGLRDKVATAPQPAKSIDDYKYEPSDKAKPFVGDLAKDQTYQVAQKAALAAGLPADSFAKFVGAFHDDLADAGLLAKPLDVRAEALAFLGMENSPLDEEGVLKQLAPVVEPIFLFIDKVATDAQLPKGAKAAAMALMDTADGMRFMAAMQKAAARQGITPGGEGGDGAATREQLAEMQKDPRADRNSPSYDLAFVEKMNELYRTLPQ